MVRVTVALVAIGLAAMFVAYAKGVGVIHGGDTLGHMYWATGAFFAVAAGDFIAIAHLIRAERLLRALRARCEQHGIAIDDLD